MIKILEPSGYLTLTSLLLVFYRISINDKARLFLYFKRDFKTTLKVILFDATLIELKFSLKLLAQFIFNETIRNDLLKDKEFLITNKSKEKSYEVYLKKVRQQIQWYTTGKCVWSNSTSLNQQQHIMISYNRDNRELCLKIKEKLEINEK